MLGEGRELLRTPRKRGSAESSTVIKSCTDCSQTTHGTCANIPTIHRSAALQRRRVERGAP